MERIILHSDLNNFFASVEAVKNPLLRGKCFAVAGDPEKRHGIILAKSQEAKNCGVRTGETIWEARQKCKDLILVKPDMSAYHRYSKRVHEIYRQYTDKIEPFGIDEAWLDVSGSTRLFGCGAKIAYEIRQKIKEELGMTVSIGVSYNKIFAKLGSDLNKPDATTIISKDNFKSVVHPLPVSDLLFVGRSTKEKLHQHGIRTIGDLAETDPIFLKNLLGKLGATLHQYAIGSEHIGIDVLEPPEVKSISNSVTSPKDLTTPEEVRLQLMLLAEQVSSRMRHKNLHGNLITLFIRDVHLHTITRQRALPLPTNNAAEIATECYSLFQQHYDLSVPIRCIGLGVSKLTPDSGDLQLTLWDLNNERAKDQTLDQTVDQLRDRYGFDCIVRGGCLHQHLKNYTVPEDNDEVSSFCTLPGCHI